MGLSSKPKNWSRRAAPIGTIRVRDELGRSPAVRYIKVRMDGPKQARWMEFARHFWEQLNGRVPPGKKVIHLDGNTLNDAVDNLALGDPGDSAFIWHDNNPAKSARNYAACRRGTIRSNIERARIHRDTSILESKWYPVDPIRQIVHMQPFRKRWQVYAAFGFSGDKRKSDSIALGWPALPVTGACVLAELVIVGGWLDGAELWRRARDRRRRLGRRECTDRERFQTFSILRKAGVLMRRGRQYRIPPSVVTPPACPVIPVRGCDLDEYQGFTREMAA